MSDAGAQKTRIRENEKPRVSATVSNRIAQLVFDEAKRLDIPESEVVRRALDIWADELIASRNPREKVLVLDRANGELRGAR